MSALCSASAIIGFLKSYGALRTFMQNNPILNKLEIHYTPKHGSWLNMAEIELSILSRQCLDRRIPDQETLKMEVAAWQAKRNSIARPMEWRFTNEDARVKLKKLYPTL